MVTGQSFVLYSRLHLVVRKKRTLHLVLAMIIIDAFILHTPTIVLTIGSNSSKGHTFAPIFNVMERIQLAIFCIQEFIISTIYIVCTVRLLGSIYHSKTRTVMIQLIVINGICLSMDAVLIGLEYSNNYVGETSAKGMIYAIKLKLEFTVLNQLMSLTQRGLTEADATWRGDANRNASILSQSSHGPGTPPAQHRGSYSMKHKPSARSGSGGAELKHRPILTGPMDPSNTSNPKVSSWTTTKIFRGSFSHSKKNTDTTGPRSAGAVPRHIPLGNDQISRTQQIDVVSEPKSATLPSVKTRDLEANNAASTSSSDSLPEKPPSALGRENEATGLKKKASRSRTSWWGECNTPPIESAQQGLMDQGRRRHIVNQDARRAGATGGRNPFTNWNATPRFKWSKRAGEGDGKCAEGVRGEMSEVSEASRGEEGGSREKMLPFGMGVGRKGSRDEEKGVERARVE